MPPDTPETEAAWIPSTDAHYIRHLKETSKRLERERNAYKTALENIASYALSVRVDRLDDTKEFALQTVDWCDGLLEQCTIAEKLIEGTASTPARTAEPIPCPHCNGTGKEHVCPHNGGFIMLVADDYLCKCCAAPMPPNGYHICTQCHNALISDGAPDVCPTCQASKSPRPPVS